MIIKSVKDLKSLRDKLIKNVNLHGENKDNIRVVVGMATCGIAAGAKPVLDAFISEVERHGLTNVTVTQTGCIGICQYEPVVEVYVPGKEKVTYIKMSAQMVAKIVSSHLVNGNEVVEYTIGAKK
jgi:NADP-reducing hydrogenase subunit HndB